MLFLYKTITKTDISTIDSKELELFSHLNVYLSLQIFQSHTAGQIGFFARPILAPEPYIWHPCCWLLYTCRLFGLLVLLGTFFLTLKSGFKVNLVIRDYSGKPWVIASHCSVKLRYYSTPAEGGGRKFYTVKKLLPRLLRNNTVVWKIRWKWVTNMNNFAISGWISFLNFQHSLHDPLC